MKKCRKKNVPCAYNAECGNMLEAERVEMLRVVEIFKSNQDGLVYPLEVIGTKVIGPTLCGACAADAPPAFSDSLKPEVERESVLLAPCEPFDRPLRLKPGRPKRKISEKVKPKQIPGKAEPQDTILGFLRPRLKTSGQALQNPWDKSPRDRGRRDFEAPTETKAMNKRQREIDNAPDPLEVVNRQAAGS